MLDTVDVRFVSQTNIIHGQQKFEHICILCCFQYIVEMGCYKKVSPKISCIQYVFLREILRITMLHRLM